MTQVSDDKPKRRDFIQLVFGWCSTFFALTASTVATARFMIPNVLYETDRRFKALKPDDYSEGATFLPDLKVFLLRKGNSFRALSAVCTHLGCTIDRSKTGFHCPCHGSVFDDTGAVLSGPAPKPLPWYSVWLSRDGRLVIDSSQEVAPDKYLVV